MIIINIIILVKIVAKFITLDGVAFGCGGSGVFVASLERSDGCGGNGGRGGGGLIVDVLVRSGGGGGGG